MKISKVQLCLRETATIPLAFFLLALLLCGATASSFAEGTNLSGLADLVKAQADYQRMLTERRIADATIQLQEAQAHYQQAKSEQLRQLLVVLQHEYARVLREEQDVDYKLNRIEWAVNRLAPLRTGKLDGGVVNALYFFINEVLPPLVLKDTMFKKILPLGIENFTATAMENDVTILAFPGGNLGTLLQFMGKNGLSFAMWSEGHQLVLDLVAAIAKASEDKVEQYRRYMDGIRSGTLPIWQLPPT